MKHALTILTALLLAAAQLPATSLSVGEKMPDIRIDLMGAQTPVSPADFQGKVVVLEFWASWCGPCLQSMRHLRTLREQFPDDLVVIAVSAETPERISAFMNNTDFPFLYASESPDLRAHFPHRVIPHTVVLAPDRRVAAITRPEALTEGVIAQLLRGEPVDLPVKEDHPWDIRVELFEVDSMARQSFQIQPARPEAPTYSLSYNEGPFRDRRRSFVNFQVPMLYREAFQTTVYRMDYPEAERPETYCVDIVVPKAENSRLEVNLRDSLDAYFGWRAAWEPREMEVWVLSAHPEGILLPPAEQAGVQQAAGDHFTSAGAVPAAFAQYLESFGIAGMPVVDETGSDQLYSFDFSFEPEHPASFFAALAEMGLRVKKEKRRIDVLVIQPPR